LQYSAYIHPRCVEVNRAGRLPSAHAIVKD
jgi:hypothetical protein